MLYLSPKSKTKHKIVNHRSKHLNSAGFNKFSLVGVETSRGDGVCGGGVTLPNGGRVSPETRCITPRPYSVVTGRSHISCAARCCAAPVKHFLCFYLRRAAARGAACV